MDLEFRDILAGDRARTRQPEHEAAVDGFARRAVEQYAQCRPARRHVAAGEMADAGRRARPRRPDHRDARLPRARRQGDDGVLRGHGVDHTGDANERSGPNAELPDFRSRSSPSRAVPSFRPERRKPRSGEIFPAMRFALRAGACKICVRFEDTPDCHPVEMTARNLSPPTLPRPAPLHHIGLTHPAPRFPARPPP